MHKRVKIGRNEIDIDDQTVTLRDTETGDEITVPREQAGTLADRMEEVMEDG